MVHLGGHFRGRPSSAAVGKDVSGVTTRATSLPSMTLSPTVAMASSSRVSKKRSETALGAGDDGEVPPVPVPVPAAPAAPVVDAPEKSGLPFFLDPTTRQV